MKQFILRNKIKLIIIFILTLLSGASIVTYTIERLEKNHQAINLYENNIDESEPEIKKIEEEVSFKESLDVEINTSLPIIRDYVSNGVYDNELENSIITYYSDEKEAYPNISELSTFTVKIYYKEKEYNSILKIVDTTKPNVKFKSIAIYENTKYDVNSFIKSYEDNSGSNTYFATFKNESTADLKSAGSYSIPLSVCDESNNCVEETVKLVINKKGNQPNNNNDNNSHPNSDTEQKREIISTIPYNYGVKKITYYDVTYNILSDGTKTEVSRSGQLSTIDYSGFNGTVRSMQPEAESVYHKTTSTINTIVSKTNEYREAVGLDPVVHSEKLSVLANIKAMEMAYSGKFDHTRPNGSDFSTLHREFYNLNGMPFPATIGENLAAGSGTDKDAAEEWRISVKHYENIINPDFNKIGVGKYTFNGKTYWVQIFSA